jgi:lysozyme
MKLDKKGYDLIKEFEGLKLKPYLCSASVPTIGYGSTYYENGTKVKLTDAPITKERADALFQIVADDFAKRVIPLIKKPVTQNQFNALVSFAFNVGIGRLVNGKYVGGLGGSTLLKLVNINPNDANIAKEFLKWNKAGGVVVKGLTNRRIKESALYYTK